MKKVKSLEGEVVTELNLEMKNSIKEKLREKLVDKIRSYDNYISCKKEYERYLEEEVDI